VVGCCECGGEPSGSCATELVSDYERAHFLNIIVHTSADTNTAHSEHLEVLGSAVKASVKVK
jgi:hypothetical protein